MIVPNFDLVITGSSTCQNLARDTATVVLRVPYSAPFAKVKEISNAVLKQTPKVNCREAAPCF